MKTSFEKFPLKVFELGSFLLFLSYFGFKFALNFKLDILPVILSFDFENILTLY